MVKYFEFEKDIEKIDEYLNNSGNVSSSKINQLNLEKKTKTRENIL